MNKQELDSIARLRKDASATNKNGGFRGKVEGIDDPDRLGRCRIRIWAIHGDEHRTPTLALPWAEVAEIGGGGYDYGSFNPPPVGSAVWCMFEGGDEDFPVIVGTFRGITKRDDENPNIFLSKDGAPVNESPWLPPDDSTETPKDIFDGVHSGDPHPTRRVLNKTYKGFTIMVEEGDGKEYMKIIDRSGQVILFDCPVEESISSGNKAQRGVRDSHRGDQMSHSAMVNRRASIRIKDLSGQEIVLDAQDQNESITIRSKSRDGSSENVVRLFSGKGKDLIEIKDTHGDKVILNPHGSESIKIEDSAGNSFLFDRDTGTIKVAPTKEYQVIAKRELVELSGSSDSTIAGDKSTEVQGNMTTNVVNDHSLGVLGNSSFTLGGASKVVINNTSPSGVEATPLDVQIANGSVSLRTLIGDLLIETLNGDPTLRTTLGNILIESVAGDVLMKTDLGSLTVAGGPNTYLGKSGATENVICGNLWTSLMATILQGLVTHNHGHPFGPTFPAIIGMTEFLAAQTIVQAGASNPSNPLSLNVFTTKLKV